MKFKWLIVIGALLIGAGAATAYFLKKPAQTDSEVTQTEEMPKQEDVQTSTAGDSASVTINYTDAGFDRPNLTVPKGTSVTWISKRSDSKRPTWIASAVHPEHTVYPAFDQGRSLGYEPLPTDNVYTFKFDKVGKWEYHDHYDPGKKGIVNVQ